jgi:hypothetical protein
LLSDLRAGTPRFRFSPLVTPYRSQSADLNSPDNGNLTQVLA